MPRLGRPASLIRVHHLALLYGSHCFAGSRNALAMSAECNPRAPSTVAPLWHAGAIPESLALHPALQALDVSYNGFTSVRPYG